MPVVGYASEEGINRGFRRIYADFLPGRWYLIGCGAHPEEEVHTMNLTKAPNTKLTRIGIKERNETILEWLRSINYRGISYNHNYDNK